MARHKRTQTLVFYLKGLVLLVERQLLGRCDFIFDQGIVVHCFGLICLHEVSHERLVVWTFELGFGREMRIEVAIMGRQVFVD